MEQINKIKQQIGQIEKAIDFASEILSENEFQNYCDHAYSMIALLRVEIKRLKDEQDI